MKTNIENILGEYAKGLIKFETLLEGYIKLMEDKNHKDLEAFKWMKEFIGVMKLQIALNDLNEKRIKELEDEL